MDRFNSKTGLVGLLIALSLVKLIIVYFIPSGINLFEAHELVQTWLKTGEFKYLLNGQYHYNYQQPVYPAVLAIFYGIVGIHPLLGITVNLVLSIGTGIAVWEFCQLWRKELVADSVPLIAALAVTLLPTVSYYEMFAVHPFSLNLFLWTSTLALGIKVYRDPALKWKIILAAFLSVAALSRPTLLAVYLPVILLWVNRGIKMKIAIRGLVVLIPAILALTLWTTRNYWHQGDFSISSSVGQNLWIGVQKETHGTANVNGQDSYYVLLDQAEKLHVKSLTPAEQNQYFLNKFNTECDETPGLFFEMFWVKMKNFWWFRDGIGDRNFNGKSWIVSSYQVFYVILLLAGILGSLFVRRAWMLWLFPIALSITQAIFYVETRHRIMIEPMLVMFAVMGIFAAYRKFAK